MSLPFSMAKESYGFEASEGFISDVTDKILPQIEDWQYRPLAEVYPLLRRVLLTCAPASVKSINMPIIRTGSRKATRTLGNDLDHPSEM